jgi:hypothetical protein
MSCKWCIHGYYPAVNVNGVVIHRTPPTVITARVEYAASEENDKFVPIKPIYKDGIEICTARGVVLLLVRKKKK